MSASSSFFVTLSGAAPRTKKLRAGVDTTPQALHAQCVSAFGDASVTVQNTRLYIQDKSDKSVQFELDDLADFHESAQLFLRPVAAPVVVQQGVRPAAAAAPNVIHAQRAVPEFLPNGRVRVNGQEFVVPRGGTGGTPRVDDGPNWFVRVLLGRPFNAVSPRSGLKRPASRWQTFAKVIYGNPFVPAKMPVSDEKKHLRRAFDKFDVDHDGELTLIEFALTANFLGRELFPLQVQAAFHRIDRNKNGAIDFDEFCAWWFTEVRAPPTVVEREFAGLFARDPAPMDPAEERHIVALAFATFDANGNGSLDAAELKQLTIQIGENLSDQEVADLLKAVDTDGDGVITFDEFYVWFVKQNPAGEKRSELVERLSKNVREYAKKRLRARVWKDTVLDPERVTAKKRKRARDLFDRFDADQNGHLDLVELGQLTTALGLKHTDQQLVRIMACIDTDHNGTIEFDEFFAWFDADAVRSAEATSVARRMRGFRLFADVDDSEERARARRAFQRFDVDGNHVIDKNEFAELTRAMGVPMSHAEIVQQIDSLDLDGNGVIDFDEFYAWWSEEKKNPPKNDRAVKSALQNKARVALASFFGQPLQKVDWDAVVPGGSQPRADDNDDVPRAAAAAKKDKKKDEKKKDEKKKDDKKKDDKKDDKKKDDVKEKKDKKKTEFIEVTGTELKEVEKKKDDDKKDAKDAKKDAKEAKDSKKVVEKVEKAESSSSSTSYEYETEEDTNSSSSGSSESSSSESSSSSASSSSAKKDKKKDKGDKKKKEEESSEEESSSEEEESSEEESSEEEESSSEEEESSSSEKPAAKKSKDKKK